MCVNVQMSKCLSNLVPVYFRAFSFKKKSSSGTTKVDVNTKVNNANVLANRNVNVSNNNNVVTKSSLTFSNKHEIQKSKISSFFTVSSKGKSDSISPTDTCSPAVSGFKLTHSKGSNQISSGSESKATNLDASLGFPVDDWDDLDDFETPTRAKKDSSSSEVLGLHSKPVSSPSEEKTQLLGKVNHKANLMTPKSDNDSVGVSRSDLSCKEDDDDLDCGVNNHTASSGTALKEDPVDCETEDSPIKVTMKRIPAHPKSVISDSEEESNSVPFQERTGKVLFVAVAVFYFCAGG